MHVHHSRSLLCRVGAALFCALANTLAIAHAPESTEAVRLESVAVTTTGTVAMLTVHNQLTGTTLHYYGLKLDQGGSYALSGSGLNLLSEGTRISAAGTLSGNVLNLSLFSVVAPVASSQVTTQAETPKSLSGTLAVFHKDFFAQGRGEYGLAVRNGAETTPLNVAAIPDALEIGMLINADGRVAADGSSLDVSTITILGAPAPQGEVAPAPITNKVLVIPIKFTDLSGEPFTTAQIQTEFQTNVAPYYQEVSYGQQLLNVTVANSGGAWLNAGAAVPGCDYNAIGTLANNAATAAGYNIDNYQNLYYVMPSNGACGWAGLGYVGWGRAYSNGVNALWVYGHELGHNFGLWHAGSIGCGSQVLGGSCGVSEYGDPFDVMGNIRQMHFNAMQKAVLNWIPASAVKVHSSGSQTYQLSPLEVGGQATYAVKIPTSNSKRTYWVEFRQPIGFDGPLSGLPNLGAQVRVGGPQFELASGTDDTEMLDMTPGSGGGFDDGTLPVGTPYVDSTTGVTINVLSATPGAAGVLTVAVSVGGTSNPTTTTLASSGSPSLVGASVTFTATVSGAAPTGNVAFTDGGSTLCSAVALAGSGNSRTATCSTSSLSAGSHSMVATYAGDAANIGSTSNTVTQVVNSSGGGADVVWIDDALPSGALGISDGEDWVWVSSNPTPYSGSLAHQSALGSAIRQHYFYNATTTLAVASGDTLYAYVYLDPANPPSEVMLQWNDGNWEHRAYWGANLIGWGTDSTASRRYMGSLPTAGAWVRLAIPAALVGLEGRTLNGMAFTLYGGRATWDRAGKSNGTSNPTTTTLASSGSPSLVGASVTFTATVSGAAPTGNVAFTDGGSTLCSAVALAGSGNSRTATCSTSSLSAGSHSMVATYAGDAANIGSTSNTVTQVVNSSGGGADVVWIDDALPSGALGISDGEDWVWVSSNPTPYSGSLAHQSALGSAIRQHYFYNATTTLAVASGDTLYAYVYLDPANPPSEVMLQWNDGNWEHRAYWGANLIGWGTDSTASRRYMGSLPTAGAWVRLAIPAALVGLEGRTLNGMAFTLYGGRATWDRAGKSNGTSNPTTTTLASSGSPSLVGASVTFTATVSGAAPTGNVAFTDGGSTLCSAVALAGSGNSRTATCSTSSLSAGSHSMVATYAGDAANIGSTSNTVTQVVNSSGGGADVVWIDDALPSGALAISDGEDWVWVSSNPTPYSGSLAHQSALGSAIRQHYFYNATTTLAVASGDTLYAYVYLDPANPPSEVMLQWNDGNWEHRAYWGANLIGWGTDSTASRRYMGSLPTAGAWVRLAIPAALVGLEGRTLNGMAFTLYGGRATWDRAGKSLVGGN